MRKVAWKKIGLDYAETFKALEIETFVRDREGVNGLHASDEGQIVEVGVLGDFVFASGRRSDRSWRHWGHCWTPDGCG